MKDNTFKELGLSQEILKSLAKMRFVTATPVQSKAIVPMMQKRDLLVQAPTGTGKTCAFGIPVIENIDVHNRSIQSIILCPTRELAIQTTKVLNRLTYHIPGVKTTAVYGGERIERQMAALRQRPQIIVATPGRMVDFLRRKTIKLDQVGIVVLDEADRMLDMGFRDELNEILAQTPIEKQTVLFSATMPREVIEIAKTYQKDAALIEIKQDTMTVDSIEQFYVEVKNSKMKMAALVDLLNEKKFRASLVFAGTKAMSDVLAGYLKRNGYKAAALHGDLRQNQRDAVMNQYRRGLLDVLVATDVASRGIDVRNIDAVINFDIPQCTEGYVHRIGRTGRAEQSGFAYTFICSKERKKLKEIMAVTKAVISPIRLSVPEIKPLVMPETARMSVSDTIQPIEFKTNHLKDAQTKQRIQSDVNKLAKPLVKQQKRNTIQKTSLIDEDIKIESNLSIREETAADGLMTKMFISLGMLDKLTKKDLVQIIGLHSQITEKQIGSISMMKSYSFFDVPSLLVQEVLKAINGKIHCDRPIRVEISNGRISNKQPQIRSNRKRFATAG